MTNDSKRVEDIPVTLRGGLRAFLVFGSLSRGYRLYYILTRGRINLYDGKEEIGSRVVEAKRGEIICLLRNTTTGYESYCGTIDEKGESVSEPPNQTVPSELFLKAQDWRRTRGDLISLVKTGKYRPTEQYSGPSRMRVTRRVLRKVGMESETDFEFVSEE